ncbi:MAG: o-succinylbenzoate synthase [Arachnia sp.]
MTPLAGIVYDIRMRTWFRGGNRRQGMLLRGEAGWAEWSPFCEYEDHEAAAWLRAAVEAATQGWPAARRSQIPVNAIIPAVAPAAAAERARASGCRTAKVKVAEGGETLDDDVARVAAVRDALGPDARIRVDANGAWSVAEAMRALRELSRFGLEYAEQPCRSVTELADLRRRLASADIAVPIAADESIRRAADPMHVARAEAADVAVIKVQPLGGVQACLRLADEMGLPVVVSSALETAVGLRQSVALAAALPELNYACGLETGSLLQRDVAALPVIGGAIQVADLDVDLVAVRAVQAAPSITAWWTRRLRRVSAMLAHWPGMVPL